MGRNFKLGRQNHLRSQFFGDHDDRVDPVKDEGKTYSRTSFRGSGGQGRGGSVKDRLGVKQAGLLDPPRGHGHIQKRGWGGGAGWVKAVPEADRPTRGGQASAQCRPPLFGNRSWRARGSRMRGTDRIQSRSTPSESWHKITLRNCAQYDKVFLLKELLDRCSVKFIPLCYETRGNSSSFYLEEQNVAEEIKSFHNKILLTDGILLQISGERSTPPISTISESMVDRLTQSMSDRYNSETCSLNLSAFHKSFPGEPFFAPLSRMNILSRVFAVIAEHIPQVKVIDLSHNKLSNLESLVPFQSQLKYLTILYLNNNRFSHLAPVRSIKDLRLVELKLEGNPLKSTLGEEYTDAVRKMFTKLQVLDGKCLPKLIAFEDEESSVPVDLPLSIPKYIKDCSSGELVLQFLLQYFKLYDAESRQSLLDAYGENAMMSMTAVGKYEDMNAYLAESRNLVRVNEHRRIKLLHKGRLPIVSFLCELPRTEHDLETFTLDLPFSSPTLLLFSVTGVFRETQDKHKYLRHFNRCFVVEPRGAGFCIINETLHVTYASRSQVKSAFVSTRPAASADSVASVVDVLDIDSKRTLATAFSAKSGMKLEWAARCLEENDWNYDKSAAVFQQLKQAGKIPPDAYVQ